MSQYSIIKKRKRTRNCSKRVKLNSQGFKVYKNFRLYIAKATLSKPAPRSQVVEITNDLWNNDPSIKKMRKFIKELSIRHTSNGIAGEWIKEKKRIVINDNGRCSISFMRSVNIHEIVGHTFWDFSRKYRRVELIAFNKLANSLKPISTYVQSNEKKWRLINDDNDELFQKIGHETMTLYANEQHSAIAEIIYGFGGHKTILNQKDVQRLIELYEVLHY